LKAWPAALLSDFASACPSASAYPVVLGAASAAHGLPLLPVCHGYLHGFAANLVSAALRLVPLGQSDGQIPNAQLQGIIADTAVSANSRALEDISNMTMMVDIASMRHETQYTRLFRS